MESLFLSRLLAWYRHRRRVLPWREDPAPYRVWVSEIMLQQTQVATVVPYFERFMQVFPDVRVLAEAREDEVLSLWSGLGYYSRARNLHSAAKKIWFEGAGCFPQTREALEALPGIGRYTAGAVASIALGQAEAILDGNVERVLARVCAMGEFGVGKKNLWQESERWVRAAAEMGHSPSDFNQALMELGALVCVPKNPKCSECPLSKACQAHRLGQESLYPPPRRRAEKIILFERAQILINKKNEILLTQESERSWRKGLWDVPTQSCEKNAFLKPGNAPVIKYVVTRHQVNRKLIVREGAAAKSSDLKLGDARWCSVGKLLDGSSGLPVGAALMKTVRALSQA